MGETKGQTHAVTGLALAGALASLAACPDRDIAAVDPVAEREQRAEIPVEIQRDLDLIFIVDDSSSMTPNQRALIQNFPRFMNVLASVDGGLPNVHIGVISTDVGGDPTPLGHNFVADECVGDGYDGRFIVGEGDEGCPGLDDQWIVDVANEEADDGEGDDDERIRNYQGELGELFTCMAELGTDGCGFEMPLESLRRALEHPDNEDFFRDHAYLGVVILSDEDDCSIHDLNMLGESPVAPLGESYGPLASFRCTDYGIRCDPVDCDEYPRDMRCEGERQNCEPDYDSPYMHPPEYYADVLREFRDENRIIVAGIIGDPEPVEVFHESDGLTTFARLAPSCATPAGDADPGVRLSVFLDQFAESEQASICDGDLSGPVDDIAQRFAEILASPCVGGNIRDMQPDQPGIQPQCSVSDVEHPGTDAEQEYPLPACDGGQANAPCWYMEPSEECEGVTPTGLALEVERADTAPPPGTRIRARCVAD